MNPQLDSLVRFVTAGQSAQQAVDAVIDHHNKKKGVNPTPLLNRQAVRELFLDTARRERPFNKFSRVSEDTLITANAMLRQWIVARVKAAPSKGVTL